MTDFYRFCCDYFGRLCRGYAGALDDTLVRGWLNGHKGAIDSGGALDLCSRMFPALCAWLSNPRRSRVMERRGLRVDLELLVRAVLEGAFDPQNPGFWGRDEFAANDQRTVESSVMAYGAWLVRDSVLPSVSQQSAEHFRRWLEYFGSGALSTNNWCLFWIINHAARKALGWEYSQETIDVAWEVINGLDRGDGWMTDGPEGCFDDYNWWVLGSHELWWMQIDGASYPDRCKIVSDRLRRRLEDYPYFFGADGSYSEYGRSLSYKWARLGTPLLAYKMGLWPHSAGMLKRLVRLHLSHYDDWGAIDRQTDTVRQTLSEFGSADVRETSISTGHAYWCMQAFAALWQIDESDAFWSAEEEPLPVERGDFVRVIKPAGWVLVGSAQGGHVQRYSLGTRHGEGAYAAKSGKFQYGTHFPVNVGAVEGDFGPDSAMCITDGQNWAHPGVYDAFVVREQYLRAKYAMRVGALEVACETVLLPRVDQTCLRIHRLAIPAGAAALTIWEGAAALGYEPGANVEKLVDAQAMLSLARCGERMSFARGLAGYSQALRAQGFGGREDLNARWAKAITPLLRADVPAGFGRELVLACQTGAACRAADGAPAKLDVVLDWRRDGVVELAIGGVKLEIPPIE